MRLPLRKAIFWLHLTTGILAGIVILIMSVTGVLLAYEQQILTWAERGLRSSAPPAGAARLSAEELVNAALAAEPSLTPTNLSLEADPVAPARVGVDRRRSLYLDPYTGRVLGEGATGVRGAFRTLLEWHRWLGVQGENREHGRAITAAANLGFLFLVVSGLYLWLPRTWTRRQVRNVAWFRKGLAGKARDFNWHNVFGLWMAVPLFFVVATAVVMSYSWANALLFRLAGDEPPRPTERRERPAESDIPLPVLQLDGLDELWALAAQQVPGWQSITLDLPKTDGAPVHANIAQGSRGRPDLRGRLTLDPQQLTVVAWEPFSSQSPGRQWRLWARWIHTGEAGGFLGQTLAAAASAAGALLVWTGLALAWRRFFPRRVKRPVPARNEAENPHLLEPERATGSSID